MLPFFKVAAQSAAVKALLGNTPRIFLAGNAGDSPAYPYVTYQMVSGTPGNLLGQAPDHDLFTLQVDVWAKSDTALAAVTTALVEAIQGQCQIAAWRSETADPQTKTLRKSFDVDWIVLRS